jgi:hypothetical protein
MRMPSVNGSINLSLPTSGLALAGGFQVPGLSDRLRRQARMSQYPRQKFSSPYLVSTRTPEAPVASSVLSI